ncbi:unnamed protein product [Nezara viridula]|uniref:Uncharacterized protein n=1 Tax=Nezara viridula TaxID=85310 RepID=A0A9P0MS23_NEZVI|nr:unnamed protein product [Nezara viridula]
MIYSLLNFERSTMPALSNGNTCWGNRKCFSMHSEYISDSFLLGLEMRDVVSLPSSGTPTNCGYQRIPENSVVEDMDVDACNSKTCEQINSVCRKRSIPAEQNIVKRLRQQDPKQQSISSETICKNQVYNSGFCLF